MWQLLLAFLLWHLIIKPIWTSVERSGWSDAKRRAVEDTESKQLQARNDQILAAQKNPKWWQRTRDRKGRPLFFR